MKLLQSQKNMLADLIERAGYNQKEFEIKEKEHASTIFVKKDKTLCFRFSNSIQGAEYCDIYYLPTNIQACKHIFLSINEFSEAIPYFEEWLENLSFEINVEDKWNP